jgi:uncharacterized protein YabE (DUF348 family)
VDGQTAVFHTRHRTVGELLDGLGLLVRPEDALSPGRAVALAEGDVISLRRARPVIVVADGRTIDVLSHQRIPRALLDDAGVTLNRYDRLLLDGQPWEANQPVGQTPPSVIEVIRAVAMTVHVDGDVISIYTTAPTIGETLHQMGIALHVADEVLPGIGEAPQEGMTVVVNRSVPVLITLDGAEIAARVRTQTVAEALIEAGFALVGEDYSIPAPEAPLPADGRLRIVRVTEDVDVTYSEIPFSTIYRQDPEMVLDEQRVVQTGIAGIAEHRTRTRYEDGIAVSQVDDPVRTVQQPVAQVIAYGTKIVTRTLETPDGPLEYWRVIPMLATSYTPATSSKPPDAPNYGIAATGIPVTKGIVAVDPEVIPYSTYVYVPGYGIGLAADTGGAVNGRRIDLGYSDDDLVLWYSWVNVYLLAPPPPESEILYILP